MKMTKGVIVGLIGGILTVLGVVLPWASATNGLVTVSMSGLDFGPNIFGMPLLVLGLLGLLMVLPGKKGLATGTIVLGIIALLIALLVMVGLSWIASGLSGIVSIGIGAMLCLVGPIIMIVGGFMVRSEAKKAVMAPPAAPMAPPQA